MDTLIPGQSSQETMALRDAAHGYGHDFSIGWNFQSLPHTSGIASNGPADRECCNIGLVAETYRLNLDMVICACE
jgi:hypothetical protein